MILKSDLCFVFRSADSYLDEPAVVSSSRYFMFSNIYLKNHEAKLKERKKKEEAAKKKEAGGDEKLINMFFLLGLNVYERI